MIMQLLMHIAWIAHRPAGATRGANRARCARYAAHLDHCDARGQGGTGVAALDAE